MGWAVGLALAVLLAERTHWGALWPDVFRWLGILSLAPLAADVVWRRARKDRPDGRSGTRWLEWFAFVPLAQLAVAPSEHPAWVGVRLAAIFASLTCRTRDGYRFITVLRGRPTRLLAAAFGLGIAAGAVLLSLPAAAANGQRFGFVDALFTATSAVCVTGLTVRNTATEFSAFGQATILALIQVGGLGIMTFSGWLAILLRRGMDLRGQAVMLGTLDAESLQDMRRLMRFVVPMTLAIEGIGFLALFVLWAPQVWETGPRLWQATFHSVSAFCNAGFSTFPDNLVRFRGDVGTNLTVAALIVSGGLGFMVLNDLARRVAIRDPRERAAPGRLRAQTRIVLTASLFLTIGGAALILGLEWRGALASLSVSDRLLTAVFQSITARTAGFNTCDIGGFSTGTLLVLGILMFVGASPGSTGGGIKTTTAAVLWATVVSELRGREHTELFRRSIPPEVVRKALSVLCVSLVLVAGFGGLLLVCETGRFVDVLFETVSAFGTVGLSTGLTPKLTTAGRLAVMALMFMGRVGPLTIAHGLARQRAGARYAYPEERVMVG
jgi:trk system potassium uptake protein TrkH